MGIANSFMNIFGLGKSKEQPDYQGEKPVRLSETPWGKTSWKSIEDALARRGTGYSPEVFDVNKAAWANQARDYLTNVATPQITSQASARGLGRSSLVPAQIARAGTEQSLDLAQKAAELQRQSEMAEIQQQMQGRGLGASMSQADVQSQGAIADFQKNIFDQQQAYRQNAEAQRQAGLLRGALTAAGAAAGGAGLLPGVAGGLGGVGMGSLAGISGDFNMFKPSTPLFGAGELGLAGTSLAKPAEAVDTGSKSTKSEFTPEELAFIKQIMGEE